MFGVVLRGILIVLHYSIEQVARVLQEENRNSVVYYYFFVVVLLGLYVFCLPHRPNIPRSLLKCKSFLHHGFKVANINTENKLYCGIVTKK